jgi:peptidoglycan hydrolase-like protein with peptidoglycan-binding domain
MSFTDLCRGSTGPETLDLQSLLHFRSPIEPAALGGFDGIFGPKTEQGVRDVQTKRSLLVDGVVGSQTWGSLAPNPPGGPDTWPRQPGE